MMLVVTVAGAAAMTRPSVPALRRTLDEILSSGYQLEPPIRIQIEQWLIWLLRRIAKLLGNLSESGPLAGMPLWLWWVIFGVCVTLLVLIFAHIVITVRSVLRQEQIRSPRQRRLVRREDPASVLHAAESALEAGEYERAVRLLYRAALLRLDRAGLLSEDPTRTNWENLAAMPADAGAVTETLAALTRTVDDTVYGGRPVSRSTAEQCRAWLDELWAAERAS